MKYVEHNGRVAGWMPTGHWEFFDNLAAYKAAWQKSLEEWLRWA